MKKLLSAIIIMITFSIAGHAQIPSGNGTITQTITVNGTYSDAGNPAADPGPMSKSYTVYHYHVGSDFRNNYPFAQYTITVIINFVINLTYQKGSKANPLPNETDAKATANASAVAQAKAILDKLKDQKITHP